MPHNHPVIDVQILKRPVQVASFEPFPRPAGGECIFVGRTRCDVHRDHGELVRLCYHAYAPLAQRVLIDLAHQAAQRFECLAVRIHHAVGDVPVGEASVVVHVVSSHRKEAFEACRFLIDQLKASAPIWKREIWTDATMWSPGAPVSLQEDR